MKTNLHSFWGPTFINKYFCRRSSQGVVLLTAPSFHHTNALSASHHHPSSFSLTLSLSLLHHHHLDHLPLPNLQSFKTRPFFFLSHILNPKKWPICKNNQKQHGQRPAPFVFSHQFLHFHPLCVFNRFCLLGSS